MERTLRHVVTALDIVSGSLFALAIGLNFANVVGRYAFHAPIFWAEEITTLLVVWAVCLLSFRLTYRGEHLVTEVTPLFLPPRAVWVLRIIATALCTGAAVFLGFYAYKIVEMLSRLSQVTIAAEIPKAFANGAILAAFMLAALGGVCRIVRLCRETPSRDESPTPLSANAISAEGGVK